jgi:hypothetical protein
MKVLTIVFVAGLLFMFSPAGDWLAVNTPDWVGALILLIGLPWGAYAFFKMLFKFAKEADK